MEGVAVELDGEVAAPRRAGARDERAVRHLRRLQPRRDEPPEDALRLAQPLLVAELAQQLVELADELVALARVDGVGVAVRRQRVGRDRERRRRVAALRRAPRPLQRPLRQRRRQPGRRVRAKLLGGADDTTDAAARTHVAHRHARRRGAEPGVEDEGRDHGCGFSWPRTAELSRDLPRQSRLAAMTAVTLTAAIFGALLAPPCARRAAPPRAQLPELRPRTAANWFVERLGCTEAEGEKAAGRLLPNIRDWLDTDWQRADETRSSVQQLLGLSEAEVRKLVLRQPQVLGYSVEENVRPTVAALRSLLGLSEAEVRKLVLRQPSVLGQSVEENLRPTVAALRQLVDLDEEEVRAAVLRVPALLSYSVERRVQPRVERTLAAGVDVRGVLRTITYTPAKFNAPVMEPNCVYGNASTLI